MTTNNARCAAVLLSLGLAAVVLAQPGQITQQRLPVDPTRDTTLYTIGYSHLDTQWRWDYQTTIRLYIRNTMLENFLLFEKYPGYVFNFTGANRYRMMREYYPAEFERVREFVAADRWFPAGSSTEENDALVPSPESLVRNILYGNDFFRKEFGRASNEYMLPDCFGFPASLPSILAHCGLKGFSTQKLTWGSAVGIPFNTGVWVGHDGGSVVAAFNPGDYVTQVKGNLSTSDEWLRRISESGKLSGIVADFMYYGTGDIGGAPSEESVGWIQKSVEGPGPIQVLSAPAGAFFDDLTPARQTHLPRFSGELLLTNHSAGSLTSQAYIKRWNRKNELLAYTAEAASVVAEWIGGSTYPREKLREAWRLVLGAQFHDILAGTCTPKANEYSWNDQVLALKQFGATLADAAGSITRALDTESKGIPVVVFNPLACEREDVVEATITAPAAAPPEVRVYGPDGHEVPSQTLERDGSRRSVAFLARIPSVGFATYDVRPSRTPCAIPTGVRISPRSLENPRYVVAVDDHGDVASITDKTAGREMLSAPIRLSFLHERPQEYPAWNMDWSDRRQPPAGFVEGAAEIRIVESGPARVSLEIARESRGSRFIQRIRLSAGRNPDRIEFDTRIEWFTRETSLKATFPLSVSNPVATYNTGAGTIERGKNDEKKFEVPSHQWLDLTDRNGEYGVSILEDSKYGSDKPADNTVRLTLLYTPGVRGSYKDQATQDLGIHDMLYALVGHKKDWREAGTVWQAARLNQPPVAFQARPHKGVLGRSFSFLHTGTTRVSVSALKKAENGEQFILRLQEVAGKPARDVRITLAAKITSATEVNGQEQAIGTGTLSDGALMLDLVPNQLRAYAITIDNPARRLNLPDCHPIPLEFDSDVISSQGDKSDGRFDETGASIPGEMVPDSIFSEGILFIPGPKGDGALNAVSCNGQTIALPGGAYNRLYLLAAGVDAGTGVTFLVEGKRHDVTVGPWSGFVGQWDNRVWDGYVPQERDYTWDDIVYAGLTPGYVNRGDVAFFTTHRHHADGHDEPYVYAYLYKVRLDLPAGARTITLPANRQVKILAITAALNENDVAQPAIALHDTLNRSVGAYARFQVTSRPRIAPESCILAKGTLSSVSISTKDREAEIFYTLDGTEPTRNSVRYRSPLLLDRTTTVKAIAYGPGRHPSDPSTTTYYVAYPVEKVTYVTPYSPKYRGTGDSNLIDGKRGSISFSNPAWQGYEAEDLKVILDLGRDVTLQRLTLGCLNDNASWIFLPASVSVEVSQDGTDYTFAAKRDVGTPAAMEETQRKDLSLEIAGVQTRYVRVVARNIGSCPPWHPGSGRKSWLFVDEIIVE